LILSTRRLFCRLLRPLEIATVCDVGSMDGSDALSFRSILPRAAIFALEPNPTNFSLMAADDRLRRSGIRILPAAASDRRGDAPFYVVAADYAAPRARARRGMSSLHRRHDGSPLAATVAVPTVRLDELLESESVADTPIALWIDTEGAAFEAIQGCSGVLRSTRMIHVEVETQPVIGVGQKLFPDVERTLWEAGFVLFATDQAPDVLQFNALFLRADFAVEKTAEIVRYAKRERLRRRVSHTIIRLMPGRLRVALGLQLTETRCR
jgi:FkbM family methyltransferase